jgi:hypothetical protein
MRYRDVSELPEQHRAQVEQKLSGEGVRRLLGERRTKAFPVSEVIAVSNPGQSQPPAKRSKYRNVRVKLEGETWDSKAEYEFYCSHLRPRKVAGDITLLLRQVTFVLEGGVRYRADFLAVKGPFEIWDVKGYDTQASKNKRKQVQERFGAEVQLWKKPKRKAST